MPEGVHHRAGYLGARSNSWCGNVLVAQGTAEDADEGRRQARNRKQCQTLRLCVVRHGNSLLAPLAIAAEPTAPFTAIDSLDPAFLQGSLAGLQAEDPIDHITDGLQAGDGIVRDPNVERVFYFKGDIDLVERVDLEFVEGSLAIDVVDRDQFGFRDDGDAALFYRGEIG